MTNKEARGTPNTSKAQVENDALYWKANIKLLSILLTVWFLVSFGAGIIFVEPLNAVSIGGFPLGFWFAQQGSIFTFVVLIFYYVQRMEKIERIHDTDNESQS